MTEEKKLTDEAVNATVKSLKWVCNQIPNDLGNSNEEKMLKAIQIYCQQGIAVIERLQAEIEQLTAKYRNLENNYEYDHELYRQYEIENQKLKEEVEYLDGCAKQFLADYQKCEIERAELQKQVDKAWKEVGKMCIEDRKDTAKEIYEILEKWAWKLKNEKGSLGNFAFGIETAMQEIKEKYSLQVGNFKLVELKKGKNDEKV